MPETIKRDPNRTKKVVQFKLSIRATKKEAAKDAEADAEEGEAGPAELPTPEEFKTPVSESPVSKKEPRSPGAGAGGSDDEEEAEETIKIVLTNDEIEPGDEPERDPRTMLSKQQRNH